MNWCEITCAVADERTQKPTRRTCRFAMLARRGCGRTSLGGWIPVGSAIIDVFRDGFDVGVTTMELLSADDLATALRSAVRLVQQAKAAFVLNVIGDQPKTRWPPSIAYPVHCTKATVLHNGLRVFSSPLF